MKNSIYDIKFFEANIYHQRFGNKKHFFNNKTNAIVIDLKENCKKILKYPTFFSIDKINLLSWRPSKHGNQSESSTINDL